MKASSGATSAGTTTFSRIPSPITASGPSATKAEPTTPPMSACEDEDGRHQYHVMRFQAIAPIRPAKTIAGVMRSASTMPLAIVAATSSERNAPAKLRTAASPTASRGDSARVEIDVATAFAVSWNPLVKSNASAVATTIHRTMSESTGVSGVLDGDALEDVRHALRRVDRVLEPLEDVLPADHQHGVDPGLEQRGERLADHAIALVLVAVDLHREVVDVLESAQARDRGGHLLAGEVQDLRLLLGLGHRRLDPVQREEVGDLLDPVDDVVQPGCERVDVLAVDRGDERLVEALDDVV